MSQVFARTASALRCSAARQSLLSRSSVLPVVQTASLSFQPTSAVHQYRPRTNPPADRRPQPHAPLPPPSKTPEELAKLPYVVRRTPSSQLPLYRTWASGGTRLTITVKKIEGDRRKMVEDLLEVTGLSRDNIKLNPTTQHIALKGDQFATVKEWLLKQGF